MDERAIIIFKAISYVELCSGDSGDVWCDFCSCDDTYNPYSLGIHDADCPVTLARILLSELGIPLLLYRVEYEYPSFFDDWRPHTNYRLAFSEQEIRELYQENMEPERKHYHPKRRNIQVTMIGEAQKILKK